MQNGSDVFRSLCNPTLAQRRQLWCNLVQFCGGVLLMSGCVPASFRRDSDRICRQARSGCTPTRSGFCQKLETDLSRETLSVLVLVFGVCFCLGFFVPTLASLQYRIVEGSGQVPVPLGCDVNWVGSGFDATGSVCRRPLEARTRVTPCGQVMPFHSVACRHGDAKQAKAPKQTRGTIALFFFFFFPTFASTGVRAVT